MTRLARCCGPWNSVSAQIKCIDHSSLRFGCTWSASAPSRSLLLLTIGSRTRSALSHLPSRRHPSALLKDLSTLSSPRCSPPLFLDPHSCSRHSFQSSSSTVTHRKPVTMTSCQSQFLFSQTSCLRPSRSALSASLFPRFPESGSAHICPEKLDASAPCTQGPCSSTADSHVHM